jgi:nitrogen-specific signal transduction histidine kinase/CheY-like chemotaxis protein
VKQVVGSGVDITARKQAEAEREKLEVQLRQTQKMEAIGTLAGGIAHDFNNILGAILGNVVLAQQDAGPGHPAQESLEQIFKSSERARNLVHKILAFSRQLPREERVQNLRSIMEEDLRLLRATLPAGIELIARFAEDTPSVLADRTEFHQVLLNLCTNSWHAMEGRSGQITLSLEGVTLDDALARHHADLRPGRYARLTVADTGKGMDAPTLERIFDPFFTTKEVDQGTGLGLSVVHGIMKHHQGAITVASQPGRGTTFELYFPAAATESRPGAPMPVKPVAMPQGRGQHVLCLDDETSLVSLIARTLERQGYRVTTFTSAEAALAMLRADPSGFELVVTDHNMPGTSGIEVAREIRKLRPELPVILTSGFITEKIRAEAEGAGIRQLLHKPYRVEDLCQTIQHLLQSVQ